MKKIWIILILILLLISLAGYKNSASKKEIEKGKLAIANKEYDKALSSFSLVLDKESDNKKTKNYKHIDSDKFFNINVKKTKKS